MPCAESPEYAYAHDTLCPGCGRLCCFRGDLQGNFVGQCSPCGWFWTYEQGWQKGRFCALKGKQVIREGRIIYQANSEREAKLASDLLNQAFSLFIEMKQNPRNLPPIG